MQGKLKTEQELSPAPGCQVEDLQGPVSEDRLIPVVPKEGETGWGFHGP